MLVHFIGRVGARQPWFEHVCDGYSTLRRWSSSMSCGSRPDVARADWREHGACSPAGGAGAV